MSLINQMLQELEERQPDGRAAASIHAQVRAVPQGKSVSGRWILLLLAALVATGGISWMLGRHMAPPKVITVRAVPALAQPAAAPSTASAAVAPSASVNPQSTTVSPTASPSASSASGVAQAVPSPTAVAAQPSAQVPASAAPLRIDESLSAAELQRMQTRSGTANADAASAPRPAETHAPAASRAPSASSANAAKTRPAPPSRNALSTEASAGVTSASVVRDRVPERSVNHPAGAAPAEPGVKKHLEELTPQQRAEAEYLLAGRLIREGKGSEAAALLRQALQLDPGHAAARQTLAGLLVELKKTPEAIALLSESLAGNPGQPAMAMLFARLQLGTGDLKAAVRTLERSEQYAGGRADYAAFLAALYQRDHRYRESIDRYSMALKNSPQNGIWWMGLGISLQAENRISEARDAFIRAKNTGALAPDLLAFVEQQLAQQR